MNRRFLSVLAIVWLAMCCCHAWHRARTGAGFPAYDPGEVSLDADGQTITDGAPPDSAGAPGAYLQVALLQMSATGLDEALLCAREVPLHVGAQQSLGLYFDGRWPTGRWWGHRIELGYHAAKQAKQATYRVASKRALALDYHQPVREFGMLFSWQGPVEGLHFLQVAVSRLREADGDFVPSDESANLPSMALTEGLPAFHLFPECGCVVALQITSRSMGGASLTKREYWRQRAQLLLAAPKDATESASEGAARLALSADSGPFVAPEPIVSGAVASLLFRDREMAGKWISRAAELGTGSDLKHSTGMDPGGSRQYAALLLGRATTLDSRLFNQQRMAALRCLLLCQDPAVAGLCAGALRWNLRDGLEDTLVRSAGLEVGPAVAASWNELVEIAASSGWPGMSSPVGRWALWLAPFAFAAWVAFGGGPRRSGPVPLHWGGLLLLGLLAGPWPIPWIYPLSLLVFLVQLAGRRGALMPWLERVVAVLAFGGQCLWCIALFDGPPLPPLLHSLSVFAGNLMWVVVGGFVLLDGHWRLPRAMAFSLLCPLVSIGLLLAGAPLEWGQNAGFVLALASIVAFTVFLFGGHRRPAPPVEPVSQPVVE